jgi:hypothetical protein
VKERPKTVAEYIQNIPDTNLRSLAKNVRAIIRESVPEVEESLKMGIPCYTLGSKMIFSIGDYTRHINLYFTQGAKLSSSRLEGSGKGMRHIRISNSSDIDKEEFSKLLKWALENAKGES